MFSNEGVAVAQATMIDDKAVASYPEAERTGVLFPPSP